MSALHDTDGLWELLAGLDAGSMTDLSQTLERIRLIKGLRSSETHFHLAPVVPMFVTAPQ